MRNQEKLGSIDYKGKRIFLSISKREGREEIFIDLDTLGMKSITEVSSNLENLIDLHGINFLTNELEKIDGLENLKNIKYLNFENNKIKETRGLENLTDLRELNFCGNKIEKITGLENLKKLE
ncbi:MAG: leucine-rich repeat domain-containing protein, partial [Promethearchaeota archaeon]